MTVKIEANTWYRVDFHVSINKDYELDEEALWKTLVNACKVEVLIANLTLRKEEE